MHEIINCSCGKMISQCRCPSKDKAIRVIKNGCADCKKTPQPQQESLQVPELTEEQRTVSVIYSCVKEERIDWAINYLKTYVAQELALQRREYENALSEAIELLEEQIDDEPCSYDHHGYCQTHWGGTDEDPTFCGMKRSKKVIQKCKALLQKEGI